MPVLTEEFVERCWDVCRAEVARALGEEEGPERTLHMDATVLLDVATWKVLTPFLVSMAAGVAAGTINAALIRRQSVKSLKDMIQERLGQRIHVDPSRAEETVLLIEELLQPFGVDRQKARRVVAVLTEAAAEPGKQVQGQSGEAGSVH